MWLNIHIYIYTHSKIKTVQQKLSAIDWPGEQRKPKIISSRTKLTKAQPGKHLKLGAAGEWSSENRTSIYVEGEREKEKKE